MYKSTALRVSAGFVAAWATSVAIGFLLGCLYAVFKGAALATDFLEAATSGNKDALEISLFVGVTFAIAAAGIALASEVFVALPAYCVARRRGRISRRSCVTAGFVIGAGAAGILLTMQYFYYAFLGVEGWFEFIAMSFAGSVSAFVFWMVIRPKQVTTHGLTDAKASNLKG